MSLGPNPTERLGRARADLRLGLPVVLSDGGTHVLAVAAETLTSGRLAGFRALGEPVLAITARRAETLKARVYDGDVARLCVPADAGRAWIAAVADPATDFGHPMAGPHLAVRGGDAAFARTAIRLAKAARLLPAALLVGVGDGAGLAVAQALTRIEMSDAGDPLLPTPLRAVVQARVPLAAAQQAQLHVFRPEDGSAEHHAIEIGRPDRAQPVLARLHSACFTGDVLGSLKCDCGPQLHAALAAIRAEGAGVLLYLEQEGRGIGLANKMRAYSLQDQGFDTVEANHRLGFEDDERDFRIGAALLRHMGFGAVRLMTNNPAKVAMMQAHGIAVARRVPLKAGLTSMNAGYLDTKARKSGHIL